MDAECTLMKSQRLHGKNDQNPLRKMAANFLLSIISLNVSRLHLPVKITNDWLVQKTNYNLFLPISVTLEIL